MQTHPTIAIDVSDIFAALGGSKPDASAAAPDDIVHQARGIAELGTAYFPLAVLLGVGADEELIQAADLG